MHYDLSIFGLGYTGLPMAALFAQKGLRVLGVDIDAGRIAAIAEDTIATREPGLADILSETRRSGHFHASTTPAPAAVFMIAVPTPLAEDKTADMSMVEAAARAIAGVAEAGNLVILQSTSPVGATRQHVQSVIEKARPELAGRLDYVYCAERAFPTNTLHEMVHNDRAVGGLTPQATARGIAFFRPLVSGRLLETTSATAELVKLAENAYRDVQVAFANELALVCDTLGLDVREVIALANHHPRLHILNPGPGVGGHCVPVDPWFIVQAAPQRTALLRAARQVNDAMPGHIVSHIRNAAAAFADPVICLLGLAYKKNIDDFRESPSVAIADRLLDEPCGTVLVVEPFMQAHDRYRLVSLEEGLRRADIVAVLTDHDHFSRIDRALLHGKVLIDTRGLFASPG